MSFDWNQRYRDKLSNKYGLSEKQLEALDEVVHLQTLYDVTTENLNNSPPNDLTGEERISETLQCSPMFDLDISDNWVLDIVFPSSGSCKTVCPECVAEQAFAVNAERTSWYCEQCGFEMYYDEENVEFVSSEESVVAGDNDDG